MWHVSSRSGVATLRTAIHLLLTYLLTSSYGCNKYTIYIVYWHLTFICLTRSWLSNYMQLQRPHSLYALIEVAYQNSVSVRLQPATASLYPLNQLLNGSRHRYADFHVEFSRIGLFFFCSVQAISHCTSNNMAGTGCSAIGRSHIEGAAQNPRDIYM